jgi:uncharacterized protein YeeX (DUF496 family)
MAQIAITSSQVQGVFDDMANDVDSSRLDEYFIQTSDITKDNLYEMAFAQKLIITVESVYINIVKFKFNSLLN